MTINNKLINQLNKKSFTIRSTVLQTCIKAGTGHVTSSFSCIDILTVLYYSGILRFNPKDPKWQERDRFIMSKGQASPALYAILADLGYFPKSKLEKFAQKGGGFGVHLQKSVPGAEITCGSLGNGFGIGAGIALSAKINKELFLTFVLIGDGECYEGSVWETAMFASHNRLNNLIAIIDRNFLCATDFTENIIELEPFQEKWKSFGWEVKRVDGHNMVQLYASMQYIRSRRSSKPLVIIADTVKGYGIERISNIPTWHGMAPKDEEIKKCRAELERMIINE